MKFDLLDSVSECTSDRIVAVKNVSAAEEYLADHFPTFPILPGVLMIETMVQAGRRLLASRTNTRLVLGEVKALRFGAMVRPGERLQVEIAVSRESEDGSFPCRGTGIVLREADRVIATPPPTAVSGRFTLRPIRTGTESI